MGINAYTTNLGVRERQSTYVPMPFEEMYAVLQEKQKRYDVADAYEREEKKKISSLTSPIFEHNKYLEDFKSKYLQEATILHNSIPDKGSSEYRRKLQDLVDKYTVDPNRKLIEESSIYYSKYVEDKAKKFNENKYSSAADFYKDFKGVDANGQLQRFNYSGFRDKVDYQKIFGEGIQVTSAEDTENSYFDPKRDQQITIKYKGKRADKIYANIAARLTPEAKADIMADKGFTTDKQLNEYLGAISTASSNYAPSYEVKNDFSLRKEMREQNKEARDQYEFGKENSNEGAGADYYDQPTSSLNPYFKNDLAEKIGNDGKLLPTGLWSTKGGFNFGSSVSNTYDENADVYGPIIRNSKKFFGNGNVGLLAYKNSSVTKNLALIPIDDSEKGKKIRANVLETLLSNSPDLLLYGPQGNLMESEKAKEITTPVLAGKSTALVAGKYNSFNPFGGNAYRVTINNEAYSIVLPTSDPVATRNHQIATAFNQKRFIDVPNWYDEGSKRYVGPKRIFVNPTDMTDIRVETIK
jgi:hypothetical protein